MLIDRRDYYSYLFLLFSIIMTEFTVSRFIMSDFSTSRIPNIKDLKPFNVSKDYDYSKSTEENYKIKGIQSLLGVIPPANQFTLTRTQSMRQTVKNNQVKKYFTDKYAAERKQIDYTYHKLYTLERQEYQDQIIDRFLNALVYDSENGIYCEIPDSNWIVFTAGPMGAGKSFTMEWLNKQNLFPLNSFVKVDPDMMRSLLPETQGYNDINPDTVGYFTQKEVGYLSEILTMHALGNGKNVLVDGSLRDAKWYSQYIETLRERFPEIKVAIIHITANESLVLERAYRRGLETGRVVPVEVLKETYHQINRSMEILTPFTDFAATFLNEEDNGSPKLLYACTRDDVDSKAMPTEEDFDRSGKQYENLLHGGPIEFSHTCHKIDEDHWKEYFQNFWKMTCSKHPSLSKQASPK